MPTKADVLAVIQEAIDAVNEQFGLDIAADTGFAPIGGASAFDSLAFVNFIAAVEETCERRFGIQLSLTEDGAGDGSHLESTDALADYIVKKCQ